MISKIKKILLAPPYIQHCSQTIYQALLGCIKMYESTSDDVWKQRSKKVKNILLNIQRPDGGFDIGYDFNFGKFHKKGESTSPELIGLIALCEYERVFGYEKTLRKAMDKAAFWIETFSIKLKDSMHAIPYGPYSTKEVMVYNGTSFACAALGCYIGITKSTKQTLIDIYRGMNKYLLNVMSDDSSLKGKFWYYSDQSREDLTESAKNKIDYYHQMQQVEVHSIAQNYYPIKEQKEIIEAAADLVLEKQQENGEVPYTNRKEYFNDLIHVWGYCSVMSGFLAANTLLDKKSYKEAAIKVKNWLIKYSWNGNYFYASLKPLNGNVNNDTYMVRSDAWVFNALSNFHYNYQSTDLKLIIENTYLKMEECDFSGRETHAQNLRKKIIFSIIKFIRK
jgi:hypothetical protein